MDSFIDSDTTSQCSLTELSLVESMRKLSLERDFDFSKRLDPKEIKPVEQHVAFTKDRIRQIERQNKVLMRRISNTKSTLSASSSATHCERKATSAINRKKRDEQIDRENEILRRKLEAIQRKR